MYQKVANFINSKGKRHPNKLKDLPNTTQRPKPLPKIDKRQPLQKETIMLGNVAHNKPTKTKRKKKIL